jgi:CheY-like chemotaxis protein
MCDTACDADIGIEKIKKSLVESRYDCNCNEPYALILMDTNMQRADGIKNTKLIKKLYKRVEEKRNKHF